MIITGKDNVKKMYADAAARRWTLPCFCSENQTTTEAILSAADDFAVEKNLPAVPIILGITCNYDHRSNAKSYSCGGNTLTGLRLFREDVSAFAGKGGPFEKRVQAMIHLDHIQFESDREIWDGDLSSYASIMFDASALPMDRNIKETAAFVSAHGAEILIEGACDEIMEATGDEHGGLTSPEKAKRYLEETAVDLMVANLGTEHRATGKELRYHGELARSISALTGKCLVLHGTSSVSNEQVRGLFSDGIVKVNIWTALERDTAPLLLDEMKKHESEIRGGNINFFTEIWRNGIIFKAMKKIIRDYLDLWYI